MVGLKEFLERQEKEEVINPNGSIAIEEGDDFIPYTNENVIIFDDFKYNLGMFFWERGGKQHLKYCLKWFIPPVRSKDYNLIFDVCLDKAKTNVESEIINRDMQDFLDCVACLGEEKVKELEDKEGSVKKQ